ncbi:hypothetical protein LCR_10105 [Aeromonas enteropelogenes]|uniref:Uncharacterized protein n=1 Tax=Aeromonas enteropelogenes TaxID=29489 RepID=A0A175VJ06_AEREN|nr:hypothetical protein LCR_10105 [Aeromonas enteropelogenes]
MQFFQDEVAKIAALYNGEFFMHFFDQTIFYVGFPSGKCHDKTCAFENFAIGWWWVGIDAIKMGK